MNTATQQPLPSIRTGLMVYLLLTLAYIVSGKLGLMLALPPGYASPIFPPAGIAVAAALIGGRKTLPWIYLGSLLLNIWAGYANHPQIDTLDLAVASIIAIASTLQAAVGGWGLRRIIGYPAPIDNRRDIWRFLLLAPIICLTSASFSVSGLWALGLVDSAGFASNWASWWFGDTLGVVVIFPLVMMLAGEPRALWQNRIRTIAVPILLVMSTGLITIYFLQNAAFNTARQAQLDDFDFQAREIALRIEQRLSAYEQVLRGARGLYSASNGVEREEFHNYVNILNLEEHYPGIQGVGFAQIIPPQEKARHILAIRKQGLPNYTVHPEGKRDLYTSIIYLEPFTGRNLNAIGYDMYSEAVRRTAMEQARDLDNSAMSGKVKLVQENDRDVQAGFLMYLPVYRNGRPHATLAERRANIIGWVYAPFRVNDLMQGILGEQVRNIDLEIYDGEHATPETLMYDSRSSQSHVGTPLFHSVRQVEFIGYAWTIKLHSLPIFEANIDTGRVTVIRIGGLLMSVLLSLLVWQLASGRARALKLAQNMTRELRESSERLKEAQRMAHIGSWELDIEVNKLVWSDEIYRIFEIDPVSFGASYEAFLNAIHPEDRDRVNKAYTDSLANRTSYDIVHRLQFSDGRIKFVHEHCETHFDADGKAIRSLGTVQDITKQKIAENTLHESESRYRAITQTASDAVIAADSTGNIVNWNQGAEIIFGYTATEIIGQPLTVLMPHRHRNRHLAAMSRMLSGEKPHVIGSRAVELDGLRKNGSEFPLELSLARWESSDRQFFTGIIRDITERKQAEALLRKSSEEIADLYNHAPCGYHSLDKDGVVRRINDTELAWLGYTRDEMVGKMSWPDLIAPGSLKNFHTNFTQFKQHGFINDLELDLVRKDGTVLTGLINATAIYDLNGEFMMSRSTVFDITERKRTERQIHNLAFYDTLTQLPNRRLLNDRLTQAMAASKRSGHYCALMFLDLDNFKPLNDTYGHAVGDSLLVEVARRIGACVRETDTVARFGGDEFVVMLGELDADLAESAAQAGSIAEKIRGTLAEPYVLVARSGGNTPATVRHHCTSSIGVVLFINHQASTEDILKWADIAMYQAKEQGRNQIQFYAGHP